MAEEATTYITKLGRKRLEKVIEPARQRAGTV
jgi:hypothetical protein